MDIYIAMEESYKNGYRKGYEDAKAEAEIMQRKGHWIIHSSEKGESVTNWAECSVCLTCGSPAWKVCPVCETKMEASNG